MRENTSRHWLQAAKCDIKFKYCSELQDFDHYYYEAYEGEEFISGLQG